MLTMLTGVKNTLATVAMISLLSGCTRQSQDDAALRAKIIGTWITANVILPDRSEVRDVASTLRPDGTWFSEYTIDRAGGSRKQTTMGTWRIENGSMIELQTNVDGVTDPSEKPGSSKIVRLDEHEMILSNYYAPRRVFFRKQ